MKEPADAGTAGSGVLHLERSDTILVATIDAPGQTVNTLGSSLVAEFEHLIATAESDDGVTGVVLISGKPTGFIAGADIEQIAHLGSAAGEELSRTGQQLLDSLAALKKPTVAAIHGACLGGGLELALACTYRICSSDPSTSLGLPEVQLGLIPGMGGTQRLPRLVGLQVALDMILTGRALRADRALRAGLVHEAVHPSTLREMALQRAAALGQHALSPRSRRPRRVSSVLLEHNAVGRALVFRKARESVIAKTHGNYPAPLVALDVIRTGYDRGMKAGLRVESRAFGEMLATPQARELIFLFFASNAAKRDPGVPDPAPDPREVQRLGVIGAGFMGSGIAAVAARHGTLVRMQDTDTVRIGKGLSAVREILHEGLSRHRITHHQFEDQLALASGTTDYSGIGASDLVIEAVFEDLDVKRQVLREAEMRIRSDAVYASNTSTIPITQIARAAEHPERVLGMHFFSPVHRMPLLEVITTADTTAEATVTAVAYGKQLGKTVIVVRDAPGFYTTRILSAYMNEAGRLLDEGTRVEDIDAALVAFGFPVGPVTLLDEVGIDVGGKVAGVLAQAYGARMIPADSMRRAVQAGRTGRKGGRGFYHYDAHGERGKVDETVYADAGPRHGAGVPPNEITERCVLAMVNEALLALQDEVLRSPRDGDLGAVFGLGFPPFRGGPFRYVDAVSAGEVLDRMEDLDSRFPGRFKPADILVDMARARKRFYSM
jgi:3-hydroxyacyl-CoA dehydrogenase/enoyl-CoA hydratase/3-hydroxybutyryl-CoA epimerase